MISIIIRTYNEGKYLEKMLISINEQEINDNVEIIVVDSGSIDNTLTICEKYDVNLIKIEKKDFTFGRSLNMGLKQSSGDYCVFISGHCIPFDNQWLKNIVSPFVDEKIGLCYGKQIGNLETKISEHMIFDKWFPIESIKYQNTSFCNNANCAIRKDIWDKFKYDEYVTGLEDIVFADSIMKNGWKISYSSESVVYHIHDESYKKIMNRYEREAITYSSLYKHEKFGISHVVKYSFNNIIRDIKNIHKFKVKYNYLNVICSIIIFRICQFYGTYKGYKYTKVNNHLRKKFYY